MGRSLLDFIKEEAPKSEWYPTTQKAIDIVIKDIKDRDYKYDKVLEPCCGDGRVSKAICNALYENIKKDNYEPTITAYGIEIDEHLRVKAKNNDINLVGKDFLAERYFMEDHHIMFLNPPFSNWDLFFSKSLLEFAEFDERSYNDRVKVAYIILPPRALESEKFYETLKALNIIPLEEANKKIEELELTYRHNYKYFNTYEVLEYIDFEEGERKARVKAPLIKIKLIKGEMKKKDNARAFFNFAFNGSIKQNSIKDEIEQMFNKKEEKLKQEPNKELLTGKDYILSLIESYNYKLQKLLLSVKHILALPQESIELLEINIATAKELFLQKEKRLRVEYWNLIFKELDSIKDRLLSHKKDELIKSYAQNLDFTEANIREVVISSIKYASSVMESQVGEFYWGIVEDILATKDSFHSNEIYTSNQKTFRYNKFKEDKLPTLDYRVIIKSHGMLDYRENINEQADKFNDFRVSALLLGYSNPTWIFADYTGETSTLYANRNHALNPLKKGDKSNFGKIEDTYKLDDGKMQYLIKGQWYHEDFIKAEDDILMTVKVYKKGTAHLKINPKFLMKLTYLALKNKGIVANTAEFEEYVNNQKQNGKEYKPSKAEKEAIKDIKTNGVNPLMQFKKSLKGMLLEYKA